MAKQTREEKAQAREAKKQRLQADLAARKGARENTWENSTVPLKRPSKKASEAIARICREDEEPWLILTPAGSGGTLVAFDDRLHIIKTGANTSMMAGSLGGERSTEFNYHDIINIEYNSGMLMGVLEVLTAAYSGGATKDYWKSGKDGAFAQNNTLPLAKQEYKIALPQITTIRERISQTKSTGQVVTASAPTSKADEIRKLAELKEQGLLTDAEFAEAKADLLSR